MTSKRASILYNEFPEPLRKKIDKWLDLIDGVWYSDEYFVKPDMLDQIKKNITGILFIDLILPTDEIQPFVKALVKNQIITAYFC
jgi:hypothetical protein